MAVRGQRTGWIRRTLRKLLADLPHVLFFFLVLPLVLIFLLIPSSWYEAEGYADLGEVDFVASEVAARVRRTGDPYDRDVVYRATDGSGLSFLSSDTLYFARAAVAEQRHVQRHVYISRQKPAGILRLFRLTAGQVFLPVGEDLQDYLDVGRRVRALVCGGGLCYTAAYGVGVLLCRRRRQRGPRAGDGGASDRLFSREERRQRHA